MSPMMTLRLRYMRCFHWLPQSQHDVSLSGTLVCSRGKGHGHTKVTVIQPMALFLRCTDLGVDVDPSDEGTGLVLVASGGVLKDEIINIVHNSG